MSGEPEEEAREYQMVIQAQLLWKKEGRKGELGLARKNLRQQHSSKKALARPVGSPFARITLRLY